MKRSLLMILSLTVLLPVKGDERESDRVDTTAIDVGQGETEKQPKERKIGLLRRIIRGFDSLDERYIEPQHYVFTVMGQSTYAFENFQLNGKKQSVTFAPDGNLKLGPYFGWRWFFLGYTLSLNQANFTSDKTDVGLSIYSSQVGIDLIYRKTGSGYKLKDMDGGFGSKHLKDMEFDGLKIGVIGLNLYYIFNHGRFSYPAAFAQSTCQKISCGSWLAGLGYMQNSLTLDGDKLYEMIGSRVGNPAIQRDSSLMFQSHKYHHINISGGYAYNWVFARNWLFCASGQIALGYKIHRGDAFDAGFSLSDLTPNMVGRFGLVYNNMRWYAGMSSYIYFNNYMKSSISTHYLFGSVNMYVGYNFGLKKKYRKK